MDGGGLAWDFALARELGREGELAFMCLVRLFTSLLPASSCCLRTYDWPEIPLKTQRSEGRELAVGGTWRQRAWDDPWREDGDLAYGYRQQQLEQ